MTKDILMKHAVAVWLIDNTCLTFEQIANFTNINLLEIKAIADGILHSKTKSMSPVDLKILTREEIKKCEEDINSSLVMKASEIDGLNIKIKKKSKYTPISRREDKPSAIMFLLKKYPLIKNTEIKTLVGASNTVIDSIRDKTYSSYKITEPKDPTLLRLCSQELYNKVTEKVKEREEKAN